MLTYYCCSTLYYKVLSKYYKVTLTIWTGIYTARSNKNHSPTFQILRLPRKMNLGPWCVSHMNNKQRCGKSRAGDAKWGPAGRSPGWGRAERLRWSGRRAARGRRTGPEERTGGRRRSGKLGARPLLTAGPGRRTGAAQWCRARGPVPEDRTGPGDRTAQPGRRTGPVPGRRAGRQKMYIMLVNSHPLGSKCGNSDGT